MSSFASSSRLIRLSSIAFDSFLEIVLFLTEKDLVALLATCLSIRACGQDNKLWWMLCRHRIAGFKKEFDDNKLCLDAVRNLTEAQTFKEFFIAFHKLQHPLMGWFRLIPFCKEYCRGGLINISSNEGQINCRAFVGPGLSENCSRLRFSSGHLQFDNSPGYDEPSYPVKITAAGLRVFYGLELLDFYDLVPLPLFFSSSVSREISAHQLFVPAVGLFRAQYGSHGKEILHMSLHRSPDSTSLTFDNNVSFGRLQLHGLKITGDQNVPANQFSFIINLDEECDIVTVFAEDIRPILIFPEQLPFPIITDWYDRLPRIRFWAQGLGQINRHPPRWNPQWVPCSFVLYDSPLNNNRVSFSILWKDANEPFRHAMDFISMDVGSSLTETFSSLSAPR